MSPLSSLVAAGLVAACLVAAMPCAHAGPASDAVARFYADAGTELTPEMRRFFTEPALGVLGAHDAALRAGGRGCIGFGLAVEAKGYDRGELSRSLELRESVQGGEAIVMAYYRLAGRKHAVEWTLRRQGRAWLVADVMSLQGGWRLSDIACG